MSITSQFEQIQEKFGPARNIRSEHKKNLSNLERLALFVTEKVGTMGFFFIIFGWTVLWLGWNILAPKPLQFDPYPAFVLWLFISNLIQIHLMPLIMIGQNIQGKHQDMRSENDFKTDKKAEEEVKLILDILSNHEKLLNEILEKLKK